MSIINLLNQIKNDEIVLPAIQRDFVWPEEKVLRLLDSIMRSYPIGIALLWETYLDLQYRQFENAFRPGTLHAFSENKRKKKLKLVLDGQQRLQSLYIALYGSYNGRFLYFDVLSGRESDDVAEEKYTFEFMTPEDFEIWAASLGSTMEQPHPDMNGGQPKYYVKVSDLFSAGVRERTNLTKKLKQQLNLTDDDSERLAVNLARFDEVLTKNSNILKMSVIDEDLPADNQDRKSEADVLEIFVRVNREGTPLSRSDLIFSMLKLNWKESAETLPEFVQEANKGNSFDIDTDFVIRCLFAVSNLGTKFDLDLLRKRQNVEKLRKNFKPCCDAIRSVLDAVSRDCWCLSSSLIGGVTTLVPFVYWLFNTPKHEVPNGTTVDFRKAFYLFALARPFSRYADSRLWRFIRDELQPLVAKKSYVFPFHGAVRWVKYWERIGGIDEALLQSNVLLTLHVVQDIATNRVHLPRNAGEMDHIFPRSILREKGFQETEINHFANFWILAKVKNQNKTNRHPAESFKNVEDTELKRALIDREALDYRRFTTFVKTRSAQIIDVVKKRIQFTDEDFAESAK
jgi:hypothetical protein